MAAAYEASLATRSLLLARLYVVKFLESNEQAASDRVAKEFANLEQHLAARSIQAAKETAELIEGAVQKPANGTQIAGQTESALTEIVSAVIKATDLVSEIAAASGEQSEGIGQVNQGLNQIDQVTQQNTANAAKPAFTDHTMPTAAPSSSPQAFIALDDSEFGRY